MIADPRRSGAGSRRVIFTALLCLRAARAEAQRSVFDRNSRGNARGFANQHEDHEEHVRWG